MECWIVNQSLIFRQLFDADSSTYTYLLADPESREAVLIDPVFEQHLRDLALVEELGLKLLYTLDTHCHADHVTGAWLMQQAVGSKIALSGRYGDMVTGADVLLDHGDQVKFGPRYLEVRATPGHTDGCVTYVLDDQTMAFTGDCLLIRSAGRCDFQQGNAATMYDSITEQIFTLPENCVIWPAHDYSGRTSSTVSEEKQFNPRIGGQADARDFIGYMENLGLPHPKKIDIAIPANCRCGRPEDSTLPVVATWGPVRQTYAGIKEIDPQWVAEHLSQVQVLDVREADEFSGELGHIPNAQLVPLDELERRVSEVPDAQPIVAVCRSGRRSGQASSILNKKGLKQVASLRG
ncbi:MAG: MBL fold metallo-hydrolase, partial [Leptolyngbyaceae cyanobacterium SM2_3_12]|nr:MBL fold metallo-hydrolase [Leptolyngbyaceae cyanobacterium SM2_3_12]